METDGLDTSDPFSVEDNNLTLDPDPYDTDIYDILDPGLFKEKNGELAWPGPLDGSPKSRPHSGTGCVCQEHNAPQAVP